jgi:hypothetical protein
VAELATSLQAMTGEQALSYGKMIELYMQSGDESTSSPLFFIPKIGANRCLRGRSPF